MLIICIIIGPGAIKGLISNNLAYQLYGRIVLIPVPPSFACDNGVLQGSIFLCEKDGKRLFCGVGYRNGLGLIAQGGKNQLCRIIITYMDGEFPFCIG